jgi:hypothetical protein
MSADGGHLGWRSGSQDINLKVDQCHGDVLPPKLRPVKIEDENEND